MATGTYTITYWVDDYNTDQKRDDEVITYYAESIGNAFEQFAEDESIKADYIKATELLQSTGEWTDEQIHEGEMSDEDINRNFEDLVEEGTLQELRILVVI